jgi:hypothetical protein
MIFLALGSIGGLIASVLLYLEGKSSHFFSSNFDIPYL